MRHNLDRVVATAIVDSWSGMPRSDTEAAHMPLAMSGASDYTILVPCETVRRAEKLLAELRMDRSRAGGHLQENLAAAPLESLAPLDLLALLFDTRRPQIFAESEVAGDGSDWSLTELSLLGDVSVAVPVTIFDDGCPPTMKLAGRRQARWPVG